MVTISSFHVIPNEVSPDEFISAEHSIRQAVLSSPRAKMIRNIWYASPRLEQVSLRLARIITHNFPTRVMARAGLLSEALTAASVAYEETMGIACRQEIYDESYIEVLMKTALEMLDWVVTCVDIRGQMTQWIPGETPLIDFVRRSKLQKVGFEIRSRPLPAIEYQARRLALAVAIVGVDRPSELVALAAPGGCRG